MAKQNANAAAQREATLKLDQLSLQVESARLDLQKKRRDEQNARKAAQLDLRAKRASTEKAEIELENTRRAAAVARASDLEHGEYMFHDGVDWETVRVGIQKLNELSRRHPGKPLTVVINSPGGSVIAGLALYDHIRDLSKRGHKMTVKVRGYAASMGGILLQAGDHRVVGPEALVLIHEVSSGAIGKVSEMQDRVNFSKLLWDKLAVILSKRSKMSAQEIKEKAFKFDWWLTAEEAIELGFADEID
ncbi:MAG TPA: Clp protease ClpP [Planktothrix sp.]|jgi:ATP-dependent Clp endopeptidase proteolytic subunit ClpP